MHVLQFFMKEWQKLGLLCCSTSGTHLLQTPEEAKPTLMQLRNKTHYTETIHTVCDLQQIAS